MDHNNTPTASLQPSNLLPKAAPSSLVSGWHKRKQLSYRFRRLSKLKSHQPPIHAVTRSDESTASSFRRHARIAIHIPDWCQRWKAGCTVSVAKAIRLWQNIWQLSLLAAPTAHHIKHAG